MNIFLGKKQWMKNKRITEVNSADMMLYNGVMYHSEAILEM